jgi:MYXO-CTERM domain-containing protein
MAAVAVVVAALVPPAQGAGALPQRWVQGAPGGWFAWSSPVIADVDGDGSGDAVTGGLDGFVYAWAADGRPLWKAKAMAPVASSPAVGDLTGDGRNEIAVGTGSLEVNQRGGLTIFNGNGQKRCDVITSDRHGTGAGATGVFNAPAIGDITGDGRNEVVFGAWDHYIYAADGDCRVLDKFENKDSVWSAPALRDVDGVAGAEIFIGGDATAGGDPHSGGYFRSLTWDGAKLVQRWVRLSSETFQSAAAIGDVNGDGQLEVVTGSGSDYCRNQNRCSADGRKVWAFDLLTGNDVAGWPKETSNNGHFLAGPALGDLDGDGRTDVVLGTTNYNPATHDFTAGAYNAFLSSKPQRSPNWIATPSSDKEVTSPPVIVDVDGNGSNEVVVNFDGQGHVLAGATGAELAKGFGLRPDQGWLVHNNAVAVGQLGSGWAIVTAGWDPADGKKGYVAAYDIPAPRSAAPWPQFRKSASRPGSDPGPAGAARSGAPRPVVVTTTAPKPKPKPKPAPTTTTAPPPPITAAPPVTEPPTTTTTEAPTTTTTAPPPPSPPATGLSTSGRTDDDGGSGPWIPITGALATTAGVAAFGLHRRRSRVGQQRNAS